MENEQIDLIITTIRGQGSLPKYLFMQVAKETEKGNAYTTVKDNQSVILHPSTSLDMESEGMLYNEFIFTENNYIRALTKNEPELLLVSY